ncbi:MAG TPA: beta-ketoacyl-[acyl-carrier-protein] synthase family protein [Niabella sp.]|nr:beta-ketoacyl-[acyl-carrier-protein] synthase family protein [Niabella sp.]HQW15553.1 beta-ketoacyl-[acyl-carrier-protein] synthase family protein [Niabella sp.]HQX20696.1 beta-ketoacyl-[acyl-carrier-protein] synthase family protein [Niabella sp.]HQX42499.1 beta-ketoacyl-[acyl-carrier-protein] synthase family protein [Niabella sp.]HRB07100.1 beta-ketoacyl-[acyl-carrier-protein] synthase family protein [Niabella sp.]
MNANVFIAGLGIISAIGNNLAENLDSLIKGEAGIGPMKRLQSNHQDILPVGEVKLSNKELAQKLGLPDHISRTALLSVWAAKEAVNNAGIDIHQWKTGFISANSLGGMDKTEDFFTSFLKDPDAGDLKAVVNHECGAVTEIAADYLGIKDFVSTVSTACSSSANSIFLAGRLIRQGVLDVVIAGGTDALARFTLNGFNTLMILDTQPCQPFDDHRRGLNLGEGAGYLVLISEKVAATLSQKPDVVLSGWANANDAHHQTASSPDGMGNQLAMNGALRKANLQPADIDYINLHGTGTSNNDIAEGAAIKTLFEGCFPPVSSTKSYTGHTLGASGGIEAVFSVLALQRNLIFPNLRFVTQMKELPFRPVTELMQKNLRHVMSNSFGFGGNCSSLVFSKHS